jgi:hypothetical protein
MDRVNALAIRRNLFAREPSLLAGQGGNWIEDLKLFAAAAIGGFVFFSTFIG